MGCIIRGQHYMGSPGFIRLGDVSKLFLAALLFLHMGTSSAQSRAAGRTLSQLGGLPASTEDTPVGEQQNVNLIQQAVRSFLSQNPSSNDVANMLPADLQKITESVGLGALPLPVLGSVPVGLTDPSVKALVASLRDPLLLMVAAFEDRATFTKMTANLTGTYGIKSIGLVSLTGVTFQIGHGLPPNFYDTQVYTVAFEDPSSIGFIYRGTQMKSQYGFIDFFTDFGDMLLTPYAYAGCPGGCQVHAGFLAAFAAVTTGNGDPATDIYASMVATYKAAHGADATLDNVRKVLNAGHSLGAALATFGAIWAGENFPQADVSMINAGAPRVGNPAFVRFFDGRIAPGRKYRLVDNQDMVPSFPLVLQGYLQTCLADGTIFFARDSLTGYVQARFGDRPLYYTGSIMDHLNPAYQTAMAFVLSH